MDTKTRILIIDDEDIVLKSCLRILKNEEYEIDTAYSGEEGLKKTDEKEYDIVITDLKMPGLGGMEVLAALRKNKPEVTVIIFTGYATVENARDALKNGAFDYIPKPFTNEELRTVVDNAVKAREKNSDAGMLDLMAIVSHEMKSPVSAVHTTAETLYRGYLGNLDPEQQKTVEKILRNCQYLEDIIRSYIDLSKMDIDNLESFSQNIDLVNDVIQPVIEIPEYADNLKKMPIVTDYAVRPRVNGDPNLLKIVVTNLINNAIKYGTPETPVRVRVAEADGQYQVSIRNEGVGISKEDIEQRLFKKFSRLKQKGTEGVKGSGLGLYICKKIVEKHHGRIWVESKVGEYATFCFTIGK
ncbi:MAG TPA: response regulator [Spirochaetota bacterium]|nr:response regulator [Spirochaetota bacterium]HPC42050.1 response regulator [Spirochaetota bacterium]HPL18166.1 response regulator [Spirochaetota bacterium]HQF09566.1 response regulator [Spirochaetota bacterium]HQH98364.1 response regulator [Spirochaetota bacterium]